MLLDSDVAIDNGDYKQGIPYCQTNSASEWNPFHKVVSSSSLGRFIINQLPTMVFREQRRMWTSKVTNFCSEWYDGTMLDGNAALTPPPGLNFVRGFFREQFGVDGNFVVIVVPNTRFIRYERRSIFNRHTQQIAFNCFANLKEALIANEAKGKDAVQLDEDFNVLAISPYKAEADMLSVQLDKLGDRRFSSVTEAVAQGLGASVVILTIPNSKKISTFVTDHRRFLVENTRHELGLVVIVAAESLKPESYSLHNEINQ